MVRARARESGNYIRTVANNGPGQGMECCGVVGIYRMRVSVGVDLHNCAHKNGSKSAKQLEMLTCFTARCNTIALMRKVMLPHTVMD